MHFPELLYPIAPSCLWLYLLVSFSEVDLVVYKEFASDYEEKHDTYEYVSHRRVKTVDLSHKARSSLKEYNEENVLKCLLAAKPIVEKENVTLIIEPLNNIDRVGYSMPYAKPVFELLKKIDSPNIKMLYDIYHQNMMGDFDMEEVKGKISLIGHFHVADAPGRHEPGTGNVDYVSILKEISKLPYNGYIGLEYRATKPDFETFGFLGEVE